MWPRIQGKRKRHSSSPKARKSNTIRLGAFTRKNRILNQ